uniref:RCK n=1 Tax=Arundo donax TaxID=35708 RepID=A0A0A9DC76_ARUDO
MDLLNAYILNLFFKEISRSPPLNSVVLRILFYPDVQIRALDPLNCQSYVRYCQLNNFCI